MRGKVIQEVGAVCVSGITPAYAGKRAFKSASPSALRDHPRVCGETGLRRSDRRSERGSPPRMRGNGYRYRQNCPSSRITPAYAGKRGFHRNAEEHQGDHPRVCGETAPLPDSFRKAIGSPPRMRGNENCSITVVPCVGITPAYAGKRTLTHLQPVSL